MNQEEDADKLQFGKGSAVIQDAHRDEETLTQVNFSDFNEAITLFISEVAIPLEFKQKQSEDNEFNE